MNRGYFEVELDIEYVEVECSTNHEPVNAWKVRTTQVLLRWSAELPLPSSLESLQGA